MTTSEFDPGRAALDEATLQCQLALDVATAKVRRLLGEAFEDGERAMNRFIVLTRTTGAEGTIKLLEDRGLLARSHYFGFLRGHLFAPGERDRARAALQALPEAIRDQAVLSEKLSDLLGARRESLERADQARLLGLAPATGAKRDRGRSRRRDGF